MFGLRARLLPPLIVAAVVVAAAPGGASNPPTSTLTVPSSVGQTVTSTWTGTVLPGVNASSNCTAGTSPSDEHAVTVFVAAGAYDNLTADWRFSISWTDPAPENRPSDLILTVVGPDGQVVGSSDGGSSTEVVAAENLPGGTYRVLACAFTSVVPIDYQGKLEISTRAPDPVLASAPAQGLEFAASVAADNQRDESEPLVEIDRAGNIYECGPTGSSQAEDYIQVSTDGGDQFHLLGTPPRGQSEAGGGGDCAVAFGLTRNSLGNYDLAFTGLGPLTGFTTGVSPDSGHRIASGGGNVTGGVTNQGGVADRQWETFVSETDVLLIYNQQAPRNTVVLRSTDKGLTFNPATAVIGARNPRFPGPIRYDDANNVVYFAWDATGTLAGQAGDFINLSISKDRGLTWTMCRVDFVDGAVSLFATADHDSAGNIYVAYGDSGAYHTYVKALARTNVDKCNSPAATTQAPAGTDPGFGPRIQVDRDAVRTTVFPWITAGGAAGRVAVSFLGTETQGDPNVGTFKASWHVYVNVSLNALSTDPASPATFSQVKATTHPMHYDSICLSGLGCDLAVPPGDRSMADFMAVDYNQVTGKLTVVFNRTNKVPDEATGHVASPMAATQIGGPTLGGGSLTPPQPVVRTSSADPGGDALSAYSVMTPGVLPPSPATANEPAGDFASVSIGPEIDLIDGTSLPNGGFTATIRVADLSPTALTNTLTHTQSQSLLWVLRFTNGHQDAAASARWNPVQGFTFGYNDYATGTTPCASPAGSGEKCLLYPGDMPIQGDANQSTGTIRLSVPRFLLRALSGPTGHLQRPSEVAATVGSRFYDATAWSLGNPVSPVQQVQSFLYPLDNTPSMDFVLPADGGGGGSTTGCKVNGGGSIAVPGGGDGKFSFNAHAGSPPKGHVAYRDGSTDFNSTGITFVTCAGSKGTVLGSGTNKNESVSFRLEVVDATPDTFSLTLTPGGSRSGAVSKGNVNVK